MPIGRFVDIAAGTSGLPRHYRDNGVEQSPRAVVSQLSATVAVPSVALSTTVPQLVAPGPVEAVTFGGTNVNTGGVVS